MGWFDSTLDPEDCILSEEEMARMAAEEERLAQMEAEESELTLDSLQAVWEDVQAADSDDWEELWTDVAEDDY